MTEGRHRNDAGPFSFARQSRYRATRHAADKVTNRKGLYDGVSVAGVAHPDFRDELAAAGERIV